MFIELTTHDYGTIYVNFSNVVEFRPTICIQHASPSLNTAINTDNKVTATDIHFIDGSHVIVLNDYYSIKESIK